MKSLCCNLNSHFQFMPHEHVTMESDRSSKSQSLETSSASALERLADEGEGKEVNDVLLLFLSGNVKPLTD